jgi:hypothetical protein
MRNIQDVILEKERQVAHLEKEIVALKLAAKILEDNASQTDKPMSQPEMAASILAAVGKPMHVSQIADQMKKKFGIAIKTTNLGVMLFRYAKRESKFYKVEGKPNTYGLISSQIAEHFKSSAVVA